MTMVQNMAGRRTRLLFLASCSNDSKPYSASFDFGRLRFRDTHSGIAYNAAADTRSSPRKAGRCANRCSIPQARRNFVVNFVATLLVGATGAPMAMAEFGADGHIFSSDRRG